MVFFQARLEYVQELQVVESKVHTAEDETREAREELRAARLQAGVTEADLRMELRQAHPEINEQLLQLLAQRIRVIYHTFEGALLLDVPRRLAGRLLDARGPASDTTTEVAEITCSHEDLAKMIGSSRQSVSAILKDWERKGWLQQAYGRIRLLSPRDLESLVQD